MTEKIPISLILQYNENSEYPIISCKTCKKTSQLTLISPSTLKSSCCYEYEEEVESYILQRIIVYLIINAKSTVSL